MRTMNEYELTSWKGFRDCGAGKFVITRGFIPSIFIYLVLIYIKRNAGNEFWNFKQVFISAMVILSICIVFAAMKWYRQERRYNKSA